MNLLISFPDSSSSFTYGVEYGRLLEKIERGDDPVSNNGFPIRVENQELLKKTCDTYGYIATFGEPYFDGWVDFLGIKKTTSNN
jgi:hypothetical protein